DALPIFVVRHGSRRARLAHCGSVGMIVGQIEQNVRGKPGSLAFLTGAYKALKLVEEFVGAKLVRILGVEVGKNRIEVVAQSGLRRLHALQHWQGPRPGARRSVRLANISRQGVTFSHRGPRGLRAIGRQRAFSGRRAGLFLRLAPDSRDVFAVVAVRQTLAGEVVPDVARGWR